MGIDQIITISDEEARDMRVRKPKKNTSLSRYELFTDFLFDLFAADAGSNSQNLFIQKAS